jgi:5-methylcytosine-specific restriction endonuclease McrA
MINIQRTLEVLGYDLGSDNKTKPFKDIKLYDTPVIDNCPSCKIERKISYKQSLKNKSCVTCHQNSPEMLEAKRNQTKIKTEEHKQKMRDNHWSKNGGVSAFKGKKHSEETKQILSTKTVAQLSSYSDDEMRKIRIKDSCTKRGIPIEQFDGFSAPENTRIRQSAEGKAWIYDVLAKANFTCIKCGERGGNLHAHHKNSFNSFPEQRFDIDNGACLCQACHDDFHSRYGKGYNTIGQFEEWL